MMGLENKFVIGAIIMSLIMFILLGDWDGKF